MGETLITIVARIEEALSLADAEGFSEISLHLNQALIAAGAAGVPPPDQHVGDESSEPTRH